MRPVVLALTLTALFTLHVGEAVATNRVVCYDFDGSKYCRVFTLLRYGEQRTKTEQEEATSPWGYGWNNETIFCVANCPDGSYPEPAGIDYDKYEPEDEEGEVWE